MCKVRYEVRTIQNGVPVWDPDSDYMDEVKPEKIITKVCSCESLDWAREIRAFVERAICEKAGYVMNTWTPRAVIIKITQTEESMEEDDMEEWDLQDKQLEDDETEDQTEASDEEICRIRDEINALESGMVLQIRFLPKGM